MKKIIAILAALAVVSMAFAQTVTISNKIETEPKVVVGTIDAAAYAKDDAGKTSATEAYVRGAQWTFDGDRLLREQVVGEGITADGRASVKGRVRFHVLTKDTEQKGILNLKPQWQFENDLIAGAKLKPIDSLEILVGHHEMYTRGFGPSIAWNNGNAGNIKIENVTGGWEGIHEYRDGLHVGFTGIDGLYVGAGIGLGWGKNGTAGKSLIKKGAFGPIELAAKYDADLFGVGAKYVGQFGGFNGKGKAVTEVAGLKLSDAELENVKRLYPDYFAAGVNGLDNNFTDAKYNHHNIYAGFEFKGLKEAKVGTTIGAAVDFDTYKKSDVMGTTAYTAFAVSANAGMDFRNGISDTVAVTVAYQSIDGKKAKVLPFYVGNDLTYSMDNAKFTLHTSYAQAGLEKSMKTYDGFTGTAVELTNGTSVLKLNPAFEFTMGASTFGFGVNSQVVNQLRYNKKTANEWAFTSMHGIKAQVSFPISWEYKF